MQSPAIHSWQRARVVGVFGAFGPDGKCCQRNHPCLHPVPCALLCLPYTPVSKLAVLELRKTFLSRVARPPRGRDVIGTATVCTILEWAGLASTPFMEYLLLKFLRKCP